MPFNSSAVLPFQIHHNQRKGCRSLAERRELKECHFPEATSKLHYVKSGLGFEYALAIVPQPPQGYNFVSYSTIAEKV